MFSGVLGIYGVYLLMMGVQGNTNEFIDLLKTDIRKFIPWIMSLLIIAILSESEHTKKIVAPFMGLVVLSFALQNRQTIENELRKIYDYSVR